MKKIVVCSVVAAGIAGAVAAVLLIKNMTVVCRSCKEELGKHDIGVHGDDDLSEYSTKDYFDECFPDAEQFV